MNEGAVQQRVPSAHLPGTVPLCAAAAVLPAPLPALALG